MLFNFFTVSGADPEAMLKQQNPSPEIQGRGGSPLWILAVLLIVGGYIFWPTSDPVTEVPSPPNYVFPADVEEMLVPDVLALGEVLREVGKWPQVMAAFDGDDLQKLGKIMNNPGILLSDIESLQWALNALNRFEGELADALRETICKAVPSLCGGAVASISSTVSDDVMNRSIRDLDFSVRVFNSLWGGGIKTVSDLVKHEGWELRKLRTFGKKSLTEVELVLENIGVKLR